MSSSSKGNNPQLWEKLLNALDEKLQLGLLEHLRRADSYNIDNKTLRITAGSDSDREYLTRNHVFQQLQLLAQDAIGMEKVEIREAPFSP